MSDLLARLTSALESRYRVARQIGVGGMATVHVAHDLRHERDVAIKVLHPELAAALGGDRFLAEIKTTAKLQHPHILPLLDSGEAEGLLYYVMPFVTGESLRSRLDRETQLPVDDSIRIAREVASALESAHRQGVVHRDIKPENILIQEDQALVADFGIALAVSAAGGARMTQTGLSLGTPAYMAPEQAMGEKVIDGRADIYALGAVLYEMLSGEAPFTGPSVQAIVARVMTEQPRPLTGQRRSVPEHVNAAVLKALEKLPADRFHSAAEMARALLPPGTHASIRADPVAIPAHRAGSRAAVVRQLLPWSIAGLAILAAGAFAVRVSATNESKDPMHLSVDVPSGLAVDPNGAAVAVSRDGSMLVIGVVSGGRSSLMIRNLSEDTLRLVPGSAGTSGGAEFSPDGKWLAFDSDDLLKKVPVSGGPPTTLAQSRWAQVAWQGNDAIIYTKSYNTGLSRVSSEGRDTATLTSADQKNGELGHWWPQVLPDRKHVLFTNYRTPADRSRIEVLSLKSGERRVVVDGGYFGRYVKGQLLFVRSRSVVSMPFDVHSLKATGTSVPLPLNIHTNSPNGWAGFAVSETGTLAYLSDPYREIELKWYDEGGNEESAIPEPGRYGTAVPSPDGRRIAVTRDGDIWIYDIKRRFFSRLTRTDQEEGGLVWTPDGKYVLYARDVPVFDIFRIAADGSRPEEALFISATDKWPTSMSPDGRVLLYNNDDEANDISAGMVAGSAVRASQPAIEGPGNEEDGEFSPDGMWISYTSGESGRNEVYLVPYPASRGSRRQQVSVDGGENAQWGPDGRTLYYTWSNQLIRVRINPRTGEIGKPQTLARVPVGISWAIGSDGRFLVGNPRAGSVTQSVKVVLNWPSLLDQGRR